MITATFLAIFFIPLFYVLVVQALGTKTAAVTGAAPAVAAGEGH